jgi:UDP-glucose 4-epimerase
MTRISIFGAGGYLGGRLMSHFTSVFDFALQGYTQGSACANDRGLPISTINYNDRLQIQKVCEGTDVIIYVSGMNADDSERNPLRALEFNAGVFGRILSCAVNAGVKRIIYFSTAHVYVAPLVGTITENTCVSSLHPYATSHHAAENLLRFAHTKEQVEGVVLRLSNSFGRPIHESVQYKSLFINDLCGQAVGNQNLIIKSSGKQYRDFIPIAEVCRIVEHMISVPRGRLDNGVFNVGSGESKTLLETANMIAKIYERMTGVQVSIETKLQGADEPPLHYIVDKLLSIGYQYDRSSFASEIVNLLEHFRKV